MKKVVLSLAVVGSLFAVPSVIDSPVDGVNGKNNWSFNQHIVTFP